MLGSDEFKTVRAVRDLVSAECGDLTPGEITEPAARLVRDERFDAVVADTSLPNPSRSGFSRVVRKSKQKNCAPLILLAGPPPGRRAVHPRVCR